MSKRKITIMTIFFLLLAGAVTYYFVVARNIRYENNTVKEKGAENVAEASKESVAKNKDGSSGTEQPKSNGQLSGTAIAITSFEQSDGLVKTSATINNNSKGTCYYNFSSPNTKPVSLTNLSQTKSGGQVCKVEISEVEFADLST